MLVEDCCQALLSEVLPELGRAKTDYAIEIGCGTFAFYCELFDRLGFPSVAVEPLPTNNLRNLCKHRNILLVEACIAENDGTIDLYVGSYLGKENLNLSSTRPDWWGAASMPKSVPSMALKSLINKFSIDEISCLKVDIEGAEYSVLSQLSSLNLRVAPKVIMFEYGGGGTFESQQGGWAEDFLQDTISVINLLKGLGYKQLIQIDSEQGSYEKIFDLRTIDVSANTLFSFGNIYGNMIALHSNNHFSEDKIENVCSKFRDNSLKAPPLKITETLSKRVSVRLRKLLYR